MVTSLLAIAANKAGHTTAILDADITGPSIPRTFGLKEKAVGTENAIYPVTTSTGIQVMSINLCWIVKTTPSFGAAPSSAKPSNSSGRMCCGRMSTSCSSICRPAPVMCR